MFLNYCGRINTINFMTNDEREQFTLSDLQIITDNYLSEWVYNALYGIP